jgi:hypothetical protein
MTDARAPEQLRQEREAFDQAKAHEARWFTPRLTIGYAGIGLLFAIVLVSGYILLHPGCYATATIGIAATALLVDIVGLVASIFKLVLQQGNVIQLKPVTAIHPDIR